MNNILNWLIDNKEWVFGGIGVSLLFVIYKFFQFILKKRVNRKNTNDVYALSETVADNYSMKNTPNLSKDAKRLLKEISEDQQGKIIDAPTHVGTMITTNEKIFASPQEKRNIVKWKRAIDNLLKENCIMRTDMRGIYAITDVGREIAENIDIGIIYKEV